MHLFLRNRALTSQLSVTVIGKIYQPDAKRVVIYQPHADMGGNTSVRNLISAHLQWKREGYFQRNRDLGQVFTPERDFWLEAIVLRTGPADGAVLPGAIGAKVFVQFFEVKGTPRLHDNDTPPGTPAKHGFSQNHRCDDYLIGIQYRSLRIVRGGVFPALPSTRDEQGKPTGDTLACLTYLRWRFRSPVHFRAGRGYAFMVGFEEPGAARGFTLANTNAAGVDAVPALSDQHDRYHGGWAIRREGNGVFPPTMFSGETPPDDPNRLARLKRAALFPAGSARFRLSPTTNGYPDVDTYHGLEFYLEGVYVPSVVDG